MGLNGSGGLMWAVCRLEGIGLALGSGRSRPGAPLRCQGGKGTKGFKEVMARGYGKSQALYLIRQRGPGLD